MGRLGILRAGLVLERDHGRDEAAAPVSSTIAGRDRAIIERWDLGRSVEEIAQELSLGDHLVEQVVGGLE